MDSMEKETVIVPSCGYLFSLLSESDEETLSVIILVWLWGEDKANT